MLSSNASTIFSFEERDFLPVSEPSGFNFNPHLMYSPMEDNVNSLKAHFQA